MSLTHDDVQDILALLDSLPYAEVTLETSTFSLRLRRAGEGVWAQETQVLAGPVRAGAAPGAPGGPPPAHPAGPDGQPPAGTATGARSLAPPGPVTDPPVTDPRGTDPPGTVAADPPGAGLLEVRAPLPGTFYRAPQPGAAPFTDIGSTVAEDTVVAIIETMKLMNAVHAGAAGTVAEICLADGQSAAQGTVLMRVRPPAGGPATPAG